MGGTKSPSGRGVGSGLSCCKIARQREEFPVVMMSPQTEDVFSGFFGFE